MNFRRNNVSRTIKNPFSFVFSFHCYLATEGCRFDSVTIFFVHVSPHRDFDRETPKYIKYIIFKYLNLNANWRVLVPMFLDAHS